eukprot:2471174-Prymnesium_polylepis.1
MPSNNEYGLGWGQTSTLRRADLTCHDHSRLQCTRCIEQWSRASRRHASDTQDVATDAGRDGHARWYDRHRDSARGMPSPVRPCSLRPARFSMLSAASHSRATKRPCAAEPELERLHTLGTQLGYS